MIDATCAAVGLDHVAINADLPFTKRHAHRAVSAQSSAEFPSSAGLTVLRFRRIRVWVARGNIPYSAVTQLALNPSERGNTLFKEAVHNTWVSPI